MAINLPLKLTQRQAEDLRGKILQALEQFIVEHSVERSSAEMEFGFICAHLAGGAGALGEDYKLWLKAPRKKDRRR